MFLTLMAAAATTCQPSACYEPPIVPAFYHQLWSRAAQGGVRAICLARFRRAQADGADRYARSNGGIPLEGLIKMVPDPKWEVLRTVRRRRPRRPAVRFQRPRQAHRLCDADTLRVQDCQDRRALDAVEGPRRNRSTRSRGFKNGVLSVHCPAASMPSGAVRVSGRGCAETRASSCCTLG